MYINEWKNIPVGYFGNFIDPLLEEIVKGRQQNSGEEGLKAGKITIFLNFKFSYVTHTKLKSYLRNWNPHTLTEFCVCDALM